MVHVVVFAQRVGVTLLAVMKIRNIFARRASKVQRRNGNIDKYFNFAYFEIILQLKHILH